MPWGLDLVSNNSSSLHQVCQCLSISIVESSSNNIDGVYIADFWLKKK